MRSIPVHHSFCDQSAFTWQVDLLVATCCSLDALPPLPVGPFAPWGGETPLCFFLKCCGQRSVQHVVSSSCNCLVSAFDAVPDVAAFSASGNFSVSDVTKLSRMTFPPAEFEVPTAEFEGPTEFEDVTKLSRMTFPRQQQARDKMWLFFVSGFG